jgi:hypothetical protein
MKRHHNLFNSLAKQSSLTKWYELKVHSPTGTNSSGGRKVHSEDVIGTRAVNLTLSGVAVTLKVKVEMC